MDKSSMDKTYEERKHTYDAPKLNWGPDEIWMRKADHLNQAATIQSVYQLYKNEVKNPMHNAMPRESLAERRARMEWVGRSLKS